MKNSKGFTLIELLIVIAIIGILSSIIYANLAESRRRGTDTKTKSTLVNIRSQAEIYFATNNQTYGSGSTSGPCTTAGTLFVDAVITNLRNSLTSTPVCYSTASAYAISVPLTSVTGHWCVDSVGSSKLRPAGAITSTAC